jgi:pimeloyl-ACP methyl ester carboxylesterase
MALGRPIGALAPGGIVHRTGTFTHRGHRLTYDDYGTGDQLLVYMHGLLLDSDLNRGIAEAMAERGHRVILLDLLGHGHSDKPTHASAYRIDSYAHQVVALLDHLEAPTAALGGVSLGANVSLFTASMCPERVQGLVLEMPVLERAVPAAALTFVPMLLATHYGRPLHRLVAGGVRRLPRTRFGPVNSALTSLALPPEVVAAVLHGVLVGPITPTQEQRAAITCPVLALGHQHDLVHPFSDANAIAAELPAGQLERAASPFELRLRPRRLTECIAEFLSDIWQPDLEQIA